jgi:phosphopantothenoylcysteine decarboxylase/phosphopantothenate--cysteine ligase
VLITAGATRASLDPVRFITNRSSGKMGYALAKMAKSMGADVTLISGKTEIRPPHGVSTVFAESAEDMYNAVIKVNPEFYQEGDLVILRLMVKNPYKC